jgi:uncharacterized protein
MPRLTDRVFHLAIPCKNLDETIRFYRDKLGCRLARQYDDRVTFDFFGDQLVCHLCPEQADKEPQMYPRHFGITFLDPDAFTRLLHFARSRSVPFFKEPFLRFESKREEHTTFFLIDPANNLLEFKNYRHDTMVY